MILDALQQTGVVPPAVLEGVRQATREGGSIINHLALQLGDGATDTWRAFAERSGRAFVATPAEAGPIDVRLLTLYQALDHLVLPRVREFTTVRLLTPDPLARLADFEALRAHLGTLVPGRRATIRLDVTTPAVFRELFGLCYPTARPHYRDEVDAAALAALMPRVGWETREPTPEEQADAVAVLSGLPFIHPEIEPADPDALGGLPAGPFVARRLLPHSRTEDQRLLVLGGVRRKDDVAALLRATLDVQEVLHVPCTLALTSPRLLQSHLHALRESV